jgi:predicted AAA+ superfamily ATPase
MRAFPVTAILGPRQCGKTLLARHLPYKHYFDLENPSDLNRLKDPMLALGHLRGLIVIDEIQRLPDLFPVLRHIVDTHKHQKYLILGSASGTLMRQSSESLAGRIGYHTLGGFRLSDVGPSQLQRLWLRGGFPRAFIPRNNELGFLWLSQYIASFLERDIPQMGITIASTTMRRLWTMLCHYHGNILNYSEIVGAFGVSDMTMRRYIDILENSFAVRTLQPWHANIGKRLVKRPKLYIRDSGILHSLLSLHSAEQVQSHPVVGASWEGFALDCVARVIGKHSSELYFWQTHNHAELDLFWNNAGKSWGIEFKYSSAPSMTRSLHCAIQDLKLEHAWIVHPGKDTYRVHEKVTALPLAAVTGAWPY